MGLKKPMMRLENEKLISVIRRSGRLEFLIVLRLDMGGREL